MIDDAEIRYLGDVHKLALAPEDIVVITLPGRVDREVVERVRDHMARIFGAERKVIVLADGAKIETLSPESA